jgi:dTDP-4-dehydrorhamnose 3,5-epimerase
MPPEAGAGTPPALIVDPTEPWSGLVSGPAIAGVVWAPLVRREDARGWFTKVFQHSVLSEDGADPRIAEAYLSQSTRGVVRGLHFQVPPHHHAKTVTVVEGAVFDVIVDLRAGSPTEGAVACYRLDAERPARLHLPAGTAHGFQAVSDRATMLYLVSTEHAPDHDTGVRFDSAGISWPIEPVVVSERDAGLPPLGGFESPFGPSGEPRAATT